MAKTVASQATNGGSIPLARSPGSGVDYQACGVPQCAQHGDAVTSPFHVKPHSQEYSARSSIPPPRRARTWETESVGRGRCSGARRAGVWLWRRERRSDFVFVVSCMSVLGNNADLPTRFLGSDRIPF